MLIGFSKILGYSLKLPLRNSFGMLKFNLPDLGEKIKEGTIKKLYIAEGDQVTQFQKLADVASDKQFTEITASDSGIIRKIHYKEEDVCQVGDLFLEIQVDDASGVTPEKTSGEKQNKIQREVKKEEKERIQSKGDGTILATPYVRGLAKKSNIDISQVKGTGQNGRILEQDVENFLKKDKKQKVLEERIKTEVKPTQIPTKDTVQTVQMSNFQKGMQKSMTESNKIPHLYLHEEFDITQTEKMRKTLKHNKTKVTLMGILIKTFSIALKKYPIMNALYEPHKNEFEYSLHSSHNVSIAVDSPNGLVVPHIKNVQNLSLLKIQEQLENLRKLSTQARLTSKELVGGTVCLSNIGTIGGVNACPLILPPQVCIVAIGKMQVLPRYVHHEVVPRTLITVSFGCDHRVIDGATVARFSNEWKKIMETPYLAFAQMH